MADDKKTTVVQSLTIGQMVTAEVIRAGQPPETVSGTSPVRTVTTSMTTGNISVRYVPRPGQPGGAADTSS